MNEIVGANFHSGSALPAASAAAKRKKKSDTTQQNIWANEGLGTESILNNVSFPLHVVMGGSSDDGDVASDSGSRRSATPEPGGGARKRRKIDPVSPRGGSGSRSAC